MNLINVGITGYTGFIGNCLLNFFHTKSDINILTFDDKDFKQDEKLKYFVKNCDIIIHLAAINRHEDLNILYETNISLVQSIIDACEKTLSIPKIIFSSSIQEELDNPYGRSKFEGRKLFENWALKNNSECSTLIIPNVFGPNCKPFYNSVVSTFCFQLVNNQKPFINKDSNINFIYVYDLINKIDSLVRNQNKYKNIVRIKSDIYIKVSNLLDKLENIHKLYFFNNTFPNMENEFDRNLFITYQSFIPDSFYPKKNIISSDPRGEFSEIVRSNGKGQFSYSFTKSNVTRGNHFHTRKIERFSVIEGSAIVKIRKINTNAVKEYSLNKNDFIDIKPWHTHSIENIKKKNLITLFWISEHYDSNNSDTFPEIV